MENRSKYTVKGCGEEGSWIVWVKLKGTQVRVNCFFSDMNSSPLNIQKQKIVHDTEDEFHLGCSRGVLRRKPECQPTDVKPGKVNKRILLEAYCIQKKVLKNIGMTNFSEYPPWFQFSYQIPIITLYMTYHRKAWHGAFWVSRPWSSAQCLQHQEHRMGLLVPIKK